MTLDWNCLESAVVDEVVAAVAAASSAHPDRVVVSAELVDAQVCEMLVLAPQVVVRFADSERSVVFEGSRDADHWAARVTALGGPGGRRWEVVFALYAEVLGAAARVAAARLGGSSESISPAFVCELADLPGLVAPAASGPQSWMEAELSALRDGDDDARCEVARDLARGGKLSDVIDADGLPVPVVLEAISEVYLSEVKYAPLDYGPLLRALEAAPDMEVELLARLSPERMYPVDAADVAVAMAARNSPVAFIRRHAAIVLLAAHV